MKKTLLITTLLLGLMVPVALAQQLKFDDDTSIEFGPEGIKIKHEEHEVNLGKQEIEIKDKYSRDENIKIKTGSVKATPEKNSTGVKENKGTVEVKPGQVNIQKGNKSVKIEHDEIDD